MTPIVVSLCIMRILKTMLLSIHEVPSSHSRWLGYFLSNVLPQLINALATGKTSEQTNCAYPDFIQNLKKSHQDKS